MVIVIVLAVVVIAAAWTAFELSQISTRPLAFDPPAVDQNVLILGYGGGQHPGAYLSDSMLLVSEGSAGTVEISIPRDLWVQLPPNSGHYAKINEALQDGYDRGGLSSGGDLAAEKVSQVVGLPVQAWALEDFSGFRQLVDALGGVDVNVERAFTAQYPANDDPAVNAAWKTIHFDAGPQHMDGERALEYARARYSTDPQEGTDFARSARQQRLVAGIRSRLLSPSMALHFVPFVNAVSKSITTNLSISDGISVLTGLHAASARHVTLDTSNVLVNAVSADGQDILEPRGNDYARISAFVKAQLS